MHTSTYYFFPNHLLLPCSREVNCILLHQVNTISNKTLPIDVSKIDREEVKLLSLFTKKIIESPLHSFCSRTSSSKYSSVKLVDLDAAIQTDLLKILFKGRFNHNHFFS